jgi:hypothetical protein
MVCKSLYRHPWEGITRDRIGKVRETVNGRTSSESLKSIEKEEEKKKGSSEQNS